MADPDWSLSQAQWKRTVRWRSYLTGSTARRYELESEERAAQWRKLRDDDEYQKRGMRTSVWLS